MIFKESNLAKLLVFLEKLDTTVALRKLSKI
jgi:hypothetical protein